MNYKKLFTNAPDYTGHFLVDKHRKCTFLYYFFNLPLPVATFL